MKKNPIKPRGLMGHPQRRNGQPESFLDVCGLTYFILINGHPAAGVTDIIELCHLRLADMPWVAYGKAAILTGIGSFHFLWAAEMSFFCGNESARFAFVHLFFGYRCHRPILLSAIIV
jgi:hypothetical protein